MHRVVGLMMVGAAIVVLPATAQVTPDERTALIELYESTGGGEWTNAAGWLGPEGSECTWYGVQCQEGRVSALELPDNNLRGLLPIALTRFPSLNWINLSTNTLGGPVPTWIGQLPAVQGLLLDHNQLDGPIPLELAGLTRLDFLGLGQNRLSGPIPSGLGNLTQLHVLELYGNQLSGPLPAELGQLSQLRSLVLGGNQLEGPIPSELGNLTELQYLDLVLNRFSGTLPDQLGGLVNLVGLWLAGNQLEGTIPPWIGGLVHLEALNLDSNQLQGTIPGEIGDLTSLVYLNLSANRLTGPIPASIGQLTQLRGLWVGANLLSGIIPPELGNLTQLEEVWLGINQLSGGIPPEVGNLEQVRFLALDNNRLSGTLPPELGDLTAVEELLLGSNDFTGTIPPELGNLTGLRVLWIGNCHLEGAIPTELGQLASLDVLSLGSNRLVGELPDSLIQLQEIDEGALELAFNGLSTSSAELRTFISSRHPGGDEWENLQTVAPRGLTARDVTSTEVSLAWTPIGYSWTLGSYQVLGSTTPGGPYELLAETSSKEQGSLRLTGLTPSTTYSLVVQTVSEPNEVNRNRVVSDTSGEISVTTVAESACQLTCSASAPATGTVDEPVSFQGNATASGCTASPGFAWSFGDDETSTEQSPTHIYGSEGTFTWHLVVSADDVTCGESGTITVFGAGAECGNGTCESGETTWTCPSDCGLGADSTGRIGLASTVLALPAAVGGQGGVGDTYWVTEAMLHNPGLSPATVTLRFVEDAHPGQVIASEPLTLPAGGALFWADFVQDLFGSTANGSVRVQADQPVMLVSRTFNDQPTGTYGQFLGAVAARRVLRPGDSAFLVGLREDDEFRTNVLLQEVAGVATAVDLRVADATGDSLGSTRIDLPAHTKVQSRLSTLGFSDFEGYAVFQVVSGGAVVAVASVVDQATGDAMTVDALHRDQATLGPESSKAARVPSDLCAKQQTVDFTWAPEFPREGESVQFTDQSSGDLRAWSWRFGDGEASAEQNPTHSYDVAGTYSVTLVVSSGAFGSSFQTQTLTVSEEAVTGLRYMLPVVARQPGASGTTWRSDLWVMNPLSEGQQVFVEYHPLDGGAVQRTSAVVRSGEQRRVEDVVGSLFPQAGDGKGALHVVAPEGVFVTSRTYNVGTTGTFGQAIPALAAGDLLTMGDTGRLLKLKSTSATRCNVGFTELDGLDTGVSLHVLEVVDGAASVVAQATYDLEPYENVQINRVFESLGLQGEYEQALALVMVTSGGRVYAYASNVDAQTGDAEFIPAMKE